MKNKQLLIAAACSMLMVGAAQAQEDTRDALKSFTYVEAQGGVQLTSTNAKMDKLITPTAALSVGHYFSPVVGARLHVNAWESKSGFSAIDKYYKWKYVTPDLDLMLNLTNLFGNPNKDHFLNLILLGGVGLNYAWDNDELKDLNLPATATPLAWDKNRLSHNLRAGLRLETNMNKPLGISLEVNANSLSDRFNSKTNDADDWMFTAMLGVNFRFGHRYQKPAPAYVPVVQEVVEDQTAMMAAAPVVAEEQKAPEKKAVEKREQVKLHKEVFYNVRISENETPSAIMKEVADFMKQYPDAKVRVVGYADKVTGNPKVNMMYSQKRAEQFKKDLVNRYGIDGSRIRTDAKGDTVQPFPNDTDTENNRNRCVIVDGEAVKVYTVYE